MNILSTLSAGSVSQLLASGSSFVGTLIAVRALGVTDLGIFIIAYGIVTFSSAALKAALIDVAIVREADREDLAAECGAAGLLSCVLIIPGLLLAAVSSSVWLILCIGPVIVWTDCARALNIATGLSHRALGAESARFAIVGIALSASFVTNGTVTLLLMAYGFAAVAASLIHQVGSLSGTSRRESRQPINRSLSWQFAGDVVLQSGVTLSGDVALTWSTSPSTLGVVRVALLPLNAATVAMAAVSQALFPFFSKQEGWRGSRRHACFVSGGYVTISAALGVCITFMPEEIGRTIFGASWTGAAALVPWLTLGVVGWASTSGPVLLARGMALGREIVTFRLILAPMQLVLPSVGAIIAGPTGAAMAYSVSGCVAATISLVWLVASRHFGRRAPRTA